VGVVEAVAGVVEELVGEDVVLGMRTHGIRHVASLVIAVATSASGLSIVARARPWRRSRRGWARHRGASGPARAKQLVTVIVIV
jgi:hypothetical protein